MKDPRITVIYHTARGDFPMVGRPDDWQFAPFLESLQRQTFRDFHVVVIDALHPDRRWTLEGFPMLKWIPFPASPWWERGYTAISAPKNHGIVHADGELVIQLDDCCEFGPDFLGLCWRAYERGCIATAILHYHEAGVFKASAGREAGMVNTYGFPEGAYGYSTFALSDALAINGYDEGFDGAKCLEDADFSARMRLIGRQYRTHLPLRVVEHCHGHIAERAYKGPGNVARPGAPRDIRCNGVHKAIVEQRSGRSRIVANRRGYTDDEWGQFGPPCAFYLPSGGCEMSGRECNWQRIAGDPDSGTWIASDPNWSDSRGWLPVFDLTERWRDRRRAEGRSDVIPKPRGVFRRRAAL